MPGRVENLKPFTSDQDREAARRNGRKGAAVTAAIKRERRETEARLLTERLLRPWEYWLKRSTYFKLRPKYRDFIGNYILCGNAAEAARMTGYSHKWARCIGCRLLARQDVRAGLHCYAAFIRQESDPAAFGIVELEQGGEYVNMWPYGRQRK